MSDIHKEIETLEISLHQKSVRCNRESLVSLLHPSFMEIGYSGTTHNLESILQALDAESNAGPGPVIWSQGFEFIDLASELVQVIYLSAREKEGVLIRHAKRTSIWAKDSVGWKLRYHQATPISSFEKTCA